MRDALAAGAAVTGTTVHVATETVDEGPILAQEVAVIAGARGIAPQTDKRGAPALSRHDKKSYGPAGKGASREEPSNESAIVCLR